MERQEIGLERLKDTRECPEQMSGVDLTDIEIFYKCTKRKEGKDEQRTKEEEELTTTGGASLGSRGAVVWVKEGRAARNDAPTF